MEAYHVGTQRPLSPQRRVVSLRSLRALRSLLVIALVFRTAVPRAQTPRPPTQVFRSGTELVLVNVVVRDKSGAVVRNLSRDDFTVSEDDKPQTITSFDFEELDKADAILAAAPEAQVVLPLKPVARPADAAAAPA